MIPPTGLSGLPGMPGAQGGEPPAPPVTVYTMLQDAIKQERAGDVEAAELIHVHALVMSPDHPFVLSSLAQMLARHDRDRDAAQVFRQLIDVEPENADARAGLAMILKNYPAFVDEAMAQFQQALKLSPSLVKCYRPLAGLLLQADRRDEAVAMLRAWIEQAPDDAIAPHLLAAYTHEGVPERASDDFVRSTFDSHADEFEDLLRNQLEYRAPELIVERVSPRLPARPLAILDVGCGTGLCAPLLKPFAASLTGIDLSAPMLRKARERGLYDELEEIELTQYLLTQRDRFDLIVAADTLIYLGALESVVAAINGALRPGGLCAFSLELLDSAHNDRDGESAGGAYELGPSGRYRHTMAYVRALLNGSGFADIDVAEMTLRKESGAPVRGIVAIARKPG
jgi:predicted TPR repeat methyltransferase